MIKLIDTFEKYGIRQLGYYVESIDETARLFNEAFGAGPFVDLGANPPASCLFRGESIDLLSRCALGQLGNMQIELIEVLSDGPDPYKEMGHYGLHHYCIWVDDVKDVEEQLASFGIEPAMKMVSGQGLEVIYFDARKQLGHYIEVNAPMEQLAAGIASIHQKGDGNEALVDMKTMMSSL